MLKPESGSVSRHLSDIHYMASYGQANWLSVILQFFACLPNVLSIFLADDTDMLQPGTDLNGYRNGQI